MSAAKPEAAEPAGTSCPLTPRQQTRNLLVFTGCIACIYLAAPVTYVGITQAGFSQRLGAGDIVASIPITVYNAFTVGPVLLAWLLPQARYLKRCLIGSFLAVAAAVALVAAVSAAALPPWMKIGALIVQAALCGGGAMTATALLWEMLGRGVAESRRGLALGLAFGCGPLLAVVSSLGEAALLGSDNFFGVQFPGLEYPYGFAVLFGLAVPVLLAAAALSAICIVPIPAEEPPRDLHGLFGGLGKFLSNPLLLTATIITVLIYTGNTISPNLNLYTSQVLGDTADQYAGMQNAIRFIFKFVAGVSLGFLLTRTNPKTGVMATASIFLLSLVWAIFAQGQWYLLAFGLYGAGELVGVYLPNYILSASRSADMRRNMAYVTMMMAPAAPAGMLFGAISETVGARHTPSLGYQASFAACAAFVLAGLLLAAFRLPARPQQQD